MRELPRKRRQREDGSGVHFIRHLPEITPAELEEMKRMNPTSPHGRQEQKEEGEFLEGAHRNESH